MKLIALPPIDYKRKRPNLAVPDQSMSIQEIVKRFVKGIPVDINQRQAVYVDQSEEDLEKLGRMDFGEKYEYASALRERAEQIKAELEELSRSHALTREKQAKAESDALDIRIKAQMRQPLDKQDGVN